jgi:hypothetical protein
LVPGKETMRKVAAGFAAERVTDAGLKVAVT